MAVCPALAAMILTYRARGGSGVAALVKRPFQVDWAESGRWYIAAVLLPIAVAVLTYAMLGASGAPLPSLHFPPGAVLATSIAFLLAAAFEELGWSGFATDPSSHALAHSAPRSSWGWCGRRGTESHCSRRIAHPRGSAGGRSARSDNGC